MNIVHPWDSQLLSWAEQIRSRSGSCRQPRCVSSRGLRDAQGRAHVLDFDKTASCDVPVLGGAGSRMRQGAWVQPLEPTGSWAGAEPSLWRLEMAWQAQWKLSPGRGSLVEAGDGMAGSVEAEPSPWKLSGSWRRRGRLSGS